MTTRENLINQFIEELGPGFDEECKKQKGNNFFLEQIWSDNMTDEVYELTEDGQHLVLMSEEDARKFKKSLKKDEIRNKINYDRIKHYIQPFQIIQVYFPFTNKPNQYSIRPAIVIPVSKTKYQFMMVTTGAYTDVIYRRYEVTIHDWKEAGLHHSSYARTNIATDSSDLIFVSNFKIYGSLSDEDILRIINLRKTYVKEWFTNPIAFMYWLITNKITDTIPIDRDDNNNVNPIQSIYDIEKSGHANCVDLAIVVYKMCNVHREFRPSTIASVSWVINDHRSDGHIFALFKYRGNTYIFDYDQINCVGAFPNYKSDSFDKAALSFSSSIKAKHPHDEVRRLSLNRQVIYVLDREDLKSVEDTSKYIDQREWLQDYSVLYKNTYNLDNGIILGIFYRVSYQGQGIYEVLRKKVGWDWKTVKQDPDINWLPQPQVKEYKDTYRSYFTTLGYKVFQAKTMKVIDKYLDPNKIEVETFDELHGKLMYKDQYQVVIDQGDEIMNEINESFTQIEADKSPHTRKKKLDLRKIPTKIVDFKDFLRKIKTPEMVMKWFLKVKVRWTPHGGSNDYPFQWPDWLIKQRMGNCFDQSIFLHYFCRAKHIDHKMYLVTWLADNGQGTGHAVPLYKKGDKVYVFAYLNPKMGFIGGPFRSYGEAKRVLDNYFLMYINQFFKAPSTPYSSYLSDDDLANFDKYYNNRKITQTEYIIEGLGKNMRSSHLFKIKVKGFAFPNPILPAYDCIVAVFRTISTIYNFFTANEEVDIDYGNDVVLTEEDNFLEESKYCSRSSLYDKSQKKKFDKIKDFNQFCKEIKTVEEALSYFIIENIVWGSMSEDKKVIIWPDELIRTKTGVCFDHAIFFHYFCKYKKIESRICLISWEGKEAWMFFGHAIPCFKRNNKIFAVIYFRPTLGWMAGPYDSWEECKDNIKQIHRGMIQYEHYHSNSYAYADYMTDDAMKELDKIYGIPDVNQVKWFCSNGYKPIRGTYFVKFRIKGFTFADPRFFAWDILTRMRDALGITPPWNEEATLLEEKLSADERRCFGLPKKKKYPMPDEAHVRAAIRFFNHCDPEDEEELARNIKKYMKKYNMKDVNVSDNNRFKKYYHPEDHKEKKKPIEESQMTSKRNIFLTSAGLENDEIRQMFLSSYGKSIKESRVLYVTAAAIDKESIAYLDECWKDLINVGINPNNIIEYNFDKHMDYDDFMKFDIAYICGGDENHLIQVINKSGMRDNFILAINNGLVYIGVSAGACIASPYVDNGLNFIPNKVDVHYSKKESTRNGSLPPKHIQINLSNDQAIWINGNNAKIIGRSKNEINNEAYDAYLYIRSCVNSSRRSLGLLETSAAIGGPVVGMEINDQTVQYSNPGMFMIQYSDGNNTGYGITNDLKTKYFLRHDKKKNKLVKEDFSEFLKDKYFGIYSINQEQKVLWNNLLTSFYENPECLTEGVRTLSLYEYFSGRRELVGDQIDYDENFNRVDPLWLDLMYNMKLQDPNKLNIPVINENYNGGDFRKHITLPQGIREFVSSSLHSNELVLCEDPKGMYLLDENNNLVSRYITQEELEILTEVLLN